jgi:hypothetical protein
MTKYQTPDEAPRIRESQGGKWSFRMMAVLKAKGKIVSRRHEGPKG